MTRRRSLEATPVHTPRLPLAARVDLEAGAHLQLGATTPALLMVDRGEGEARVGARTAQLGPGDMVRVRPAQVVVLKAETALTGWWLHVTPPPDRGDVPARPFGASPALRGLLSTLQRLGAIDDAARLEALDREIAEASVGLGLPLPLDTPLGRVAQLGLERRHGRISLEEMCAVAGLERHTLMRRCRRFFGLTPSAFSLALRLGAALGPLARGMRPVDVAHAFGFSDQSHFIRRFVAAFGVTPGAFCAQAANVGSADVVHLEDYVRTPSMARAS